MTGKRELNNSGRPLSKITVVLYDRQVANLDRVGVSIRLNSGVALSRSELIRGIVESAIRTTTNKSTPIDFVRLLSLAWQRKKPTSVA